MTDEWLGAQFDITYYFALVSSLSPRISSTDRKADEVT